MQYFIDFTTFFFLLLNLRSTYSLIGSDFSVNASFSPSVLDQLLVGDCTQIYVNLTVLDSIDNSFNNLDKIVLQLYNDHPKVATLTTKQPLEFNLKDYVIKSQNDNFELAEDVQLEYSFNLTGRFVGRAFISTVVQLHHSNGSIEQLDDLVPNYPVPVWRQGSEYEVIFTVVISLLSAITTFLMGTQVEWGVIREVLKKPVAPAIGFFCQFLMMPLIALAWGKLLLQGEPLLQLGYFAVGCCPGGKASNYWSILLNANLDLSVTLTIISNLAAFVMMPIWLLTVGKYAFDTGTGVYIPFPNMIGSLLLLLIPTGIGMLVRVKKPELADKLGRLLKPLTILIVVVLVVVANVINWYIYLLFTVKKVLAGILLPWTGFALAFVLAWIGKRDFRDMKTIAIETGIQNASVAIIIILFSLNHPDSDLTMVMPIVCLIFTPLPLVIYGIYLLINGCIKKRKAAKTGDLDQNNPADRQTKEAISDNKQQPANNGHTNLGMVPVDNTDHGANGVVAHGVSHGELHNGDRSVPDPVHGTYGIGTTNAMNRLPPLEA